MPRILSNMMDRQSILHLFETGYRPVVSPVIVHDISIWIVTKPKSIFFVFFVELNATWRQFKLPEHGILRFDGLRLESARGQGNFHCGHRFVSSRANPSASIAVCRETCSMRMSSSKGEPNIELRENTDRRMHLTEVPHWPSFPHLLQHHRQIQVEAGTLNQRRAPYPIS